MNSQRQTLLVSRCVAAVRLSDLIGRVPSGATDSALYTLKLDWATKRLTNFTKRSADQWLNLWKLALFCCTIMIFSIRWLKVNKLTKIGEPIFCIMFWEGRMLFVALSLIKKTRQAKGNFPALVPAVSGLVQAVERDRMVDPDELMRELI